MGDGAVPIVCLSAGGSANRWSLNFILD